MLNLIESFSKIVLPISVAHAHCDIPCCIYDPGDAIQAAQTVVRMTELIEEIDFSGGPSKELGNSLMRYVSAKEDHATKAKEDILIIWTDYFKPEHLEKYPDLHDLFWQAMKNASKTRQQVSLDAAEELLESVRKIAEIFWATKGSETKRQAFPSPAGGEIVYPVSN